MPYVSIDVDLEDFDTQDLIDELAKRNTVGEDTSGLDHLCREVPPLNSEDVHPLHRVYHHLKLGNEPGALDVIRLYLSDELGVVL